MSSKRLDIDNPSSRASGETPVQTHTDISIVASAASVSATSTLAIAAQRMFYGGYPNKGAAIFVTISSQLVGYGLAGMMRGTLLFPTKMLYPANLPITTVLETLHRDKSANHQRMKVFWIVFAGLFFWTIIPEVSCANPSESSTPDVAAVYLSSAHRLFDFLLGRSAQLGVYKPGASNLTLQIL